MRERILYTYTPDNNAWKIFCHNFGSSISTVYFFFYIILSHFFFVMLYFCTHKKKYKRVNMDYVEVYHLRVLNKNSINGDGIVQIILGGVLTTTTATKKKVVSIFNMNIKTRKARCFELQCFFFLTFLCNEYEQRCL